MRTLFALILLPLTAVAQPFTVAAVEPAANSLTAAPDGPVLITFTAPVDHASLTLTTAMVFGRWSGAVAGSFTLEQDGTRLRFTPARPFTAGETVTVSLSRGLRSTNAEPLPRGYSWQFIVRTEPGALDFAGPERIPVRAPGERWLQTYGAFAGDFDEDGYTDFAVPNEQTNDVRLFLNDGQGGYGSFTVYPIPEGARPSTNEGADFNHDGHLDFAVGNSRGQLVSVFLGAGDGTLAPPQNYLAGFEVRGLAVLDLDGDGFADIATANRGAGNVTLLRNQGDATFVRTALLNTPADGETAAAAADANGDGLLDLFVGALASEEVLVLLGDGAGGLTLHTRQAAGGASWMIATGDVDGDGHVDAVSANSDDDNVSVLLGDGAGGLSAPTTYPTGAFPLAVDLGDLDGDGDLDLVTSNYSGTWTVYENEGAGRFTGRRTLRASRAASCAVLHDRDRDGTLDLTGIDELDDLLFLFTNAPSSTAREEQPRAASSVLLPPYPNPVLDQATLPFRLKQPGPVRLDLYDLRGRHLQTLAEGWYGAGRHEVRWLPHAAPQAPFPSGTYLLRLITDTGVSTHALVLLGTSGRRSRSGAAPVE